ncbi:hypothetical protein T265_13522, partial [Opisthorchis viverrini]
LYNVFSDRLRKTFVYSADLSDTATIGEPASDTVRSWLLTELPLENVSSTGSCVGWDMCCVCLTVRLLFSMPNSECPKQRGDQPFTWQRNMKEIKRRLGAVDDSRLPGYQPMTLAFLLLSNKSSLYGSEVLVLNTDIMLSMLMEPYIFFLCHLLPMKRVRIFFHVMLDVNYTILLLRSTVRWTVQA